MTSRTICKAAALLILTTLSFGASELNAQVYSIPWWTIDSGGGYSDGGNFELEGTIGQYDAGTTMTGGNFALTGGFWAGESGPPTVTPLSLQITLGSLNSGGVAELAASDNQYLVLDPTFQTFRYQLIYTVDTTSPSSAPSVVAFSYESKAQNFVGTVEQKIELFNYVSGQFELVDTRLTTGTDSVVSVTPTGDPARFVEPGTNTMQARISYENSLPFWVFSTQNLYLPYRVRVDHIFWTITP